MNELLSIDGLKYIIESVIVYAQDAKEEYKENRDSEFYRGKMLAYYEVLDTIKNRLYVRDADLKEFGLDMDLDRFFDNGNSNKNKFDTRTAPNP